MDLGIAGKIAFVGGGSKGMGLATARLLSADRCKVAIVAREQNGIDNAVNELREKGGEAIGVSADLATRAGVNSAVAAVTAEFGSPDIVVGLNNDVNFAYFDDSVDEIYEEVFRNLTMSQIYLARATVPEMRQKKWGRFIHIGSLVAKEPQLMHPHIYHNTVRPSTVAFLRTLAHEVAGDGVTVNAIGPGWIRTPQFEWYTGVHMGFSPEQTDRWLAGELAFPNTGGKKLLDIPMRRAGRMEELGGVAAFLASDLGGYVTGHWFAVDGGRHAFTF
jgi:NAD(P)-dependent dehydrogenase (short-subunit alcohol dehydrogenase family)